MVLPGGGPDAGWLGDILARNGWIDAGVAELSVTELGVGVGLLGSVRRVRLRYERPVAAAGLRNPASVVVKLPSDNPANRAIAEHFGYHARELGVYRHLLPRPGVATPTCYATDETADGLPVLVLEDLGQHRHGDQVAGASEAEALAAAALLGSIHAAFWDDPRLRRQRWLPGPTDPVVAGYGELFAMTWPTFLQRHADGIDSQHLATAAVAIDRFSEVCSRFAHGVVTLVHGDYRLDNLLFSPSGDAIALDWQLAAWGRGPYDLAFFAAGSIETELRRRIEVLLVDTYHDALAAGGVGGYRRSDCWDDYRFGLVMNLPNPVTAAVAVDPGNHRGASLLAANASRALAAVHDHWS